MNKILSTPAAILFTAWLLLLSTPSTAQIAEGDYYLYNRAAGKYLNAGATWGVQAVFGEHAMKVSLTSIGNGKYYISTGFAEEKEGYLGLDNGFLYVDCNRQAFTISQRSNGYYNIATTSGTYLGYNGSDVITPSLTNASGYDAQWELQTKTQLLTTMLSATANSPVDATFLLSNPRMDRNLSDSNWEGSSFTIGGEAGGEGNGNFCAEVWNSNFDVYQTIENIPNGTYRLTVQGFYRYNNSRDNTNSVAVSTHANGTEKLYAQLYAGNVSTPLQSIVSEQDHIAQLQLTASNYGLPFSMEESSHAFSVGLYGNNQVEVTVTDHQLTLGVRKTRRDGCDWTVWDNFELILLVAGDNTGYQPDDNGEGPDYNNASPDNPCDMTSLIKNPEFESTSGWNGSPVLGGPRTNRNAEKYNTTFDVYQTLTGLPNGWYRLSAQGFYRYGDYHEEQHKSYYGGGWEENDANNIYAVYTVPYAVISHQLGIEKQLATLYANHVEKGLPSPFDYAHEEYTHADDYETIFGWVPDTQTGAAGAFADGEYPVSLLVPVTNGTLRLGVRKSLGYKYDWACWDHFHLDYLGKQNLVYATDINTDATVLSMIVNEQRQVTATIVPATASEQTLSWQSSDNNVVTVDQNGLLTAKRTGTAIVSIIAEGSEGSSLTKTITVTVSTGTPAASNLVINEIQVSNVDMFLDPSLNYGGYIELYNPKNKGVTLEGLYLSDDDANLQKCRLTAKSGALPAYGHAVIWFDHHDLNDGQVDFKLDMDGGTIFISDSYGNLLTSQTYPPAVSRTSYARTTDGGSTWAITAYPTPGTSNANSQEWVSADSFTRLEMPQVSESSQFFTSSLSVAVSIPYGATLRYTTDGTTPTDSHGQTSTNGLFNIQETTLLRLRLYQRGKLPSPVRTVSYLKRDKDYMLPVLSVVGDPAHFYSDETGVFVTGTNGVKGSGIDYECNWNMDWDRPVAFNFITTDNQEAVSQEVTLQRFGGWSRSWYPFNFKLNAQKPYENQNYIEYQLFPLKLHLKHKVWQLRNGGNDLNCRIKDVAIQQIVMTSGIHLDCQDYLPVHSFINGRYQGMLNIREPSNKHFAYANYGIDTDEMDQMELGSGITVHAGTSETFNEWLSLSASAADATTYEQICGMVDIDEFINYMATQLFLGGDDWPSNNCKAFKGNDGKFHIVLFDVDQALRFDAYSFTHLDANRGCPLVTIFLNMMENDTFRKQFIDTYCLIGGSVFEPNRCAEIIDRIASEMNPALALEGTSTEPTATYVKTALSTNRRDKMMAALASWSPVRLSSNGFRATLGTNIESAHLQINGIDVPTGHFDGTLFAPITLHASAPAGYAFTGWKDAKNKVISTEEDYVVSKEEMLTLTATFQALSIDEDMAEATATPIKVNEISAGNTVEVSDLWDKGDWIELYNNTDTDLDATGLFVSDDISQPLKYQITADGKTNTIIPARSHLIVWADKLEGISQLHADFKLSNDSGNMVVVTSSDAFVAANSSYFNQHPGMKAFANALPYVSHRGDQAVGHYPDGHRNIYLLNRPTIEQANSHLTYDRWLGEEPNLMVRSGGPFELPMVEGWNWISHNLSTTIGVSSLSDNALRIVGKGCEAYNDSHYGMTGNLKQLTAGHLYKVQMKAADTFTSTALPCAGNMAISIQPGWNWLGYPVEGMQALPTALADYMASEGDMLVGQDGFATYSGGRWSGSLSNLETGKGYMLLASKAQSLRFRTPEVKMNTHRLPKNYSSEAHYGIDRHAYPNVMGIIARLEIDGQIVTPERLTILVWSDDEKRGVAQWVDSLAFLTIHGEGGESLRYTAIDNVDNKVYLIAETHPFTQGVMGTIPQPTVLTIIGESTGTDAVSPTTMNSTSSAVTGYYSLSGMFLSRHAFTLPKGIYIAVHADGTHHKIHIR